jgi:mono/diheme cytochrome c family protein
MQAPPAHTVSVESAADTGVLASGLIAGQPTAAIPVPITPELLRVGKHAFGVFCAACHGAAGFGGSIVASNMVEKRPPSLRGPMVRALPAGTIFRVATDGFGIMPPYRAKLTTSERWAVVAYVEHLQNTPTTDHAAIEDSLRALSFTTPPVPDSR